MASRRAVAVLRPASNAYGLRRECAQRVQFSTRTLTSRASQPRKLAQQPQQFVRLASSAASKEELGKTGLYELHSKYGAKFVPFGGYYMPVQYSDQSIIESHTWTREKASLFDVGHMVQHNFSGPGAEAFLERITPAGIAALPERQSTLSTLLHPETGGIVDDTVITRLPGKFYVVTNAGCREKDTAYLTEQLESWKSEQPDQPVEWKILDGQGLIALQGPLSADILARVLENKSVDDLKTLYFGQCVAVTIKGTDAEVLVSRAGYTGEDGFEISIPSYATEAITQFLLDSAKDELRFAGLGARDTLRLEAGMCLYGHDLDDTTTPVEAALSWIIGKDRRAKGGFHGDSVILQQLKKKSEGGGVSRRRIGLVVEGAPAREGAEIVNEAGEKIGNITSGCPSPTLKKNISMGYIKDGMHKAGTEVDVVVRGKKRKAVVTKMPFVAAKYFKQATTAKA
ncbi:glycine cleavage system T protein [Dothidotthia symphoricarpi CBS 119687]|uniref:Aminomethyltransferase n=1 Tax=Dothidotthia symphoricarpi CBS 119687 TaxID=1392245 RepID=A0A6A6AMV3_9PLEO|nr:glycine cleavage system T protein [Dothidotthia symphoricarpi CBS 119687]KAF2131811.1 glycine cleavage system T protein [Dothidotthia symphoricarpi CBS 119687]